MNETLTLILIGLVGGIASGFVGIGGGIVIVPALVFFLGFSQHNAQGTTLAMMIPPIGLLAVWNYYKSGMVNIKAAVIMTITFFIGGYLGSKLAVKLPADVVKKIFGFLMLIAAFKLIFNK